MTEMREWVKPEKQDGHVFILQQVVWNPGASKLNHIPPLLNTSIQELPSIA